MTPIRILVADDHPVVRDGLVSILSTQPDFEVVGEAATGVEVVQQAAALHPDVILLDLEMPELDGVQAFRQVRAADPNVQAIVFTAFDTDERIVGAVQAGAQGYLLKGAPRSEIFNAIRVVSQGGSLLQPVVASRLLQRIRSDEPLPDALTERETEVLHLLAQGKPNKEIAAALVISERTVKFHISSILQKLGAGNRTEAVTIAAQRGLVNITGQE
ncbi:MAG: response regulator transcription factor [Anaerolineae bacterium]|nr:response regulator transcription factor [Anaerolineae bacterium]